MRGAGERRRGGGWLITPSARSMGDGPTGRAATEEGGARRRPASPSLWRWDAKLRATAPLSLLPQEKESVAIGREDATMASRNNDAGDLDARAVEDAAFLVVILR